MGKGTPLGVGHLVNLAIPIMPFVQLKSTPPPTPYAIKNHQKLMRVTSYLSVSQVKQNSISGTENRNQEPVICLLETIKRGDFGH